MCVDTTLAALSVGGIRKNYFAQLCHAIQTILTFTIPVTSLTLDANAYKSGEVCCQ